MVTACLDNLWGPVCQYTCPTCYNGGVCDDVSGRCVCPPGFSGDHCQIACEAGKFGQGCSGSCTNLESGRTDCSEAMFCLPDPYGCSCAAGWTGLQCDQGCPVGSYGAGCTVTCHCDSTGSCDSVTGACSNGCEDGWVGDQCQALRSDLSCPTGYFGTLCSYPCQCAGGVDCQRTNGLCPNGVACAEGWAGSDCQQALPRLLESPRLSDVTKDSVLLIWNAWTDGYDYGNGPVHSYHIDYTWTKDKDNTGESEVPLIIIGDSTAEITGLSGFRYYDFYVSVRREVEGQVVAGIRSGPISAKPYCQAPQPVDSADFTSDSYNHMEITWSEPSSQCGAPSYNVSRRLLLIDQCDDSMADTVTWEVTGDTSIEYDDLLSYSAYEFTVLATLEGYDAETVYVIAYNSTESISTAPPEYFTVDSTVKGQLEYTWTSPPCGDRNGAVSYDYEFGEAGEEYVQRGNLMMASKSFEDLQHYVMYEFTVCPRTVVGPGPCISIQTRTLPSDVRVSGLEIGLIVVVVAVLLYAVAITFLHIQLR
eukprot:XP_011674266.1 PREDICTED: tenascin-like [Strongylocentrotus purpuratus]